MKFVSYLNKKEERLGILFNDKVYDLQKSASSIKIKLPSTMKKFLEGEDESMKLAQKVFEAIRKDKIRSGIKYKRTYTFISDPKSNFFA